MTLSVADVTELLALAGVKTEQDPRFLHGFIWLGSALAGHEREGRIDSVQRKSSSRRRERSLVPAQRALEKAIKRLSEPELRFDLVEAWSRWKAPIVDEETANRWGDEMGADLREGRVPVDPLARDLDSAVDTVRALAAALASHKPVFRRSYDSTATIARLMQVWRDLANGEPTFSRHGDEPRGTPFTIFASRCLEKLDGMADFENEPLYIKDVNTAVASLRRSPKR